MAGRSSGVVWAAVARRQQWQYQGVGSGASMDVDGGGGSAGGGAGRGGQRRLLHLACVGAGLLTGWLALHARGPGQSLGGVSGACRCIRGRLRWQRRWQGGGAVALALLGSRQGRAAVALACTVCLRPRVEVRGGQRRLLAAPAGGGGGQQLPL